MRYPSALVLMIGAVCACGAASAAGGVMFNNFPESTFGGGARWDAAPRTITISGVGYERSLDGGLRYSLQGGSFEAFRDLFTWDVVPSVGAFQTAVQQAFDAWSSVDPATGLTTQLYFVPDLATPVMGFNQGAGGYDARGAEIDLFGSTSAANWNPGASGRQGETYFDTIFGPATLTTGYVNYPESRPIRGADIILNSNPEAVYSLDLFRRLLTHELGHAIGLGDVDVHLGKFIDDNYDGSSSATALATLTNSWALLVDPYDPANSPLSFYNAPFGNPGFTTPGVDILMESVGLGIGPTNPLTNLVPLTNDDYGMRQILYPSVTIVPEPATILLMLIGATVLRHRRRERSV